MNEIDFVKIIGREGPGSWVPVIKKTLVHSTVNPEKEAKIFVNVEWDRIKDAQSLVVFGLGGGFHISELLSRKEFQISVIEANGSLVKAMIEKWPELLNRIDVFADFPPFQLAAELQQSGAFSQTYALLKHPASIRLYPLFYKALLQFLNERTLSRLRELSQQNERLSKFFDSLDISEDQLLTLPMVEAALVRRGTGLDKEALIWMAMRELVI
jgi:hypothetical protein